MAKTIEFTMHDENGDEYIVEIPTRNAVCSGCDGEGHNSRHLGVIEPDDFDTEGWDNYLAGKYDQTCETCNGQRVVAVMDERWLDDNLMVKVAVEEAAREDAAYRHLCYMERLMGA
jgi:hypothetical protein